MQMQFNNHFGNKTNTLRQYSFFQINMQQPQQPQQPQQTQQYRQLQLQLQQQQQAQIRAVPTQPPVKKVAWGQPTWMMLHTLSCKVKEESFPKIRKQLLELIYTVCTNLPCPECAAHSKSYLDAINFNTIQRKEDLKRLLFEFHNAVNRRKGYALFDYKDYDKYSNVNTNLILQVFMNHFEDRAYRSVKLIATDLHRGLISNKMKEWFNANIYYFDT
jgi:hypothetical protein